MSAKLSVATGERPRPGGKSQLGAIRLGSRQKGSGRNSRPHRRYTADEVGDAEDALLSNAVSRAAAKASAK